MKKILYTVLSLMVAAFSLQSCEDVPAPYDIPGSEDTPAEEEITAQGTGTADDPYNVAGILAATADLESGSSLAGTVYVTGVVTSVTECSSSYGNATFYIGDTDDASKTFYVYRCLGLNNKSITSDDAVQEGDTVTICGTVTNYNGTIETTQKGAYIYKSSRLGGASTPAGDAIVKTCAEASEIALALSENSVATTETYSITGYITSIVGSVSQGQQTFWMADTKDGGKVFEAYWANLPEGVSEFKVGSKVTITGNIMKYNTTPEIKNATVVILEEGSGSSSTTPSGDVITKTCAQAAEIALALTENSVATSETYAITGYITSIVGSVSMNQQTFWMADTKDGGQVFEAYWANLPSGVSEFTVGMKVKITGNLMKYNTTPEIKNATVEILEGGSGGSGSDTGGSTSGGGSVSGNTTTWTVSSSAVGGVASGTALTTITLSDGTTLTFDGGGNSNSPKYYTTGGDNIRVYPKNSITVSGSKQISSVVITCQSYSGTDCTAEGQVGASAGSVSFSGLTCTVSGVNATSTKITNNNTNTGTASQLRFTKLEITYASGAKRKVVIRRR